MKLHRKNINKEFNPQKNLDFSAKGNPFTTPSGYFDSMSSDILKTVGTVSIFALFRFKPLHIAIGVVTTMAVATSIYFFASSNSDNKDNKNFVVESSPLKPNVIIQDNNNQIISIIPAQNASDPVTIIIDPDVNPQDVTNWMKQLPIDSKMQNYFTDEYQTLIADSHLDVNAQKNADNKIFTAVNNNVGIPPHVFSAFELLPHDTCSEQTMTLNAHLSGSKSYLWNTGATTPEINVNTTGVYKVSVTLEDNKVFSKSISVKVIPHPNLSNDYLVTACAGSIFQLSVDQKNSEYQYYWPQYKLNTPQITASKSGHYYANVIGCQTYIDSFFVVCSHCELGIPHMVTPNGDGINETFTITNLKRYPNTELQIFDRHNQLIFKSTNYQNNWDASSTEDGSYFFILKFTDGTIHQKGIITVKH